MPRRYLAMMRALLLFCLTGLLAAQEPKPPHELERLAERVDTAHQPLGKKAIEAFDAALLLEQKGTDAPARGQVELEARYLDWHKPGTERTKTLFRYELAGSSKKTEQGVDRNGPWATENGTLVNLEDKERGNDRDNIKKRTNLARQLVRCLDPGTVLRSLQQPGAVVQEPLKIGRLPPVSCTTVEGRLEQFPLLQTGGTDAPVRIKVFVHEQTSRVVALEVWPLDDKGEKDKAHGEFIRFDDHQDQAGLLLPMKVEHFLVGADGARSPQLLATIVRITLFAKLRAEDFDRPAK